MKLLIFSGLNFVFIIALLFKAFKNSLIRFHNLVIFTFSFWTLFLLLQFENFSQNLANLFGFRVPANLVFVLGIAILFAYIVRLRIELVQLKRGLREVIVQTEVTRLRKSIEN